MEKNIDFVPADYSPLVLAYLGDAYFELLVRGYLTKGGDCTPAQLNKLAKEYVTAAKQSIAAEKIFCLLSEDELRIYKSGRNAKSGHTPKSASVTDYRRATGLEALFGYLHLSNNHQRAVYLFEKCFKEDY